MRRQFPRWLGRGALALALPLCVSLAAHAQKVKLETSAGDIVVELAPDKAPKTVANFLQYVKDKH